MTPPGIPESSVSASAEAALAEANQQISGLKEPAKADDQPPTEVPEPGDVA